MSVFKIDIEVKDIESDIDSIERVLKFAIIEKEMHNSEESKNQVE